MNAMAFMLKTERQQHRATVVGLQDVLQREREEINIFLKDMKNILDEMKSNELNASSSVVHVISI